ncbi:MAG: hypothetical protein ABIW19_08555 [Vicinamibacterales bacterium]
MNRSVILATATAATLISLYVASPDAQTAGRQVEVYSANGAPLLGFEAAEAPSRPTDLRPNSLYSLKQDVRFEGRVTRGVGFRAWPVGAGVRVLVVTMVPKDAKAPRTSSPRLNEFLYFRLAAFDLGIGESRSVSEMRALGVDPLLVKAFPPGPHEH